MPLTTYEGKSKLAFADDGTPIEKHKLVRNMDPDGVRTLLEYYLTLGVTHYVQERSGARREQGLASTAKTMWEAGNVYGIAMGLGFTCVLVAPNSWKSSLHVTSDKDSSLNLARSLVPARLAPMLRLAKHHNRAEAVLIGLWGAKKL